MQKVKIITDSSCDLDLDYLKELNVEMCPLVTIFDNKEFLDRVEISPSEFYDKLEGLNELPKTSQTAPTLFVDAFKKSLEDNLEVLCIAFSSKLSGTYQSAVIAKEMLNNNEKIHVIDSLSATIGQGLIVEKAALMAKEGKSLEEISKVVLDMKNSIIHYAGVGSLEMLKKGGRISSSQALIGNLLGLKPIIQVVEGGLIPYDKVRGKKGLIKSFVEVLEKEGNDIQSSRIAIGYSKDIDFANQLKEELNKKGVNNILISEIGAVIGSHLGAGSLVISFIGK